jgi:hypothetical protein
VSAWRLPAAAALALLLLAWQPTHALHADEQAEEAAETVARALEGSWPKARKAYAAWRTPWPLGRLDTSGFEVVLWRPVWSLDAAGRLAPFEEESLPELRQAGHRRAATPDPRPVPAADGPFHAIEALYEERLIREVRGMGDLPTGSPLAALPDPSGSIGRFLAWQRHVYHPLPPEQSSDAAWAAHAKAAKAKADTHRSRAHQAALLTAFILLALTLLVGARTVSDTTRS